MDEAKSDELQSEIAETRTLYATRHGRNYTADWMLAGTSIVLTAVVSIVGVVKPAHPVEIMAVLSIVNAALIASHRVGAFGELAQFQRLVMTEAQNLFTELKLSVDTEEKFQSVVDRLRILRNHASKNLPRGEGIQSAIKLREELGSKKLSDHVG